MAVHIKIPESKPVTKTSIYLLYINISHLPQHVQFILCSAAVFILFIIYGFMQELIFTFEGFKPYGWYLTLIQFGFYTIFGYIERIATGNFTRSIPLKVYLLLALLTLGTIGFSNSSLAYLNYPTQVIFKCCKLIPVLIGSIVIQGKRYGALDFGAAALMCIGLILFTLADSQVSPNFDGRGVAMITIALICDAVIGNMQEAAMRTYSAPNSEIVLYSYGLGFIYILVTLTVTGMLRAGAAHWATQPMTRAYGAALLFSLAGYLGVGVVLTLVRTCGAFAAVSVTTARKAVTILVSFLAFSKPFVCQYLWAGLLVVGGIYLQLLAKRWRGVEPKWLGLWHSLASFPLFTLGRKRQYAYSIAPV